MTTPNSGGNHGSIFISSSLLIPRPKIDPRAELSIWGQFFDPAIGVGEHRAFVRDIIGTALEGCRARKWNRTCTVQFRACVQTCVFGTCRPSFDSSLCCDTDAVKNSIIPLSERKWQVVEFCNPPSRDVVNGKRDWCLRLRRMQVAERVESLAFSRLFQAHFAACFGSLKRRHN